MATIMIVDDSALSRKASRRILESAGYGVIDAASGMEALERYSLQHPNAVLLDVTMPDLNGLDVLQQLLAMDANARVVMATADIQNSTRELAAAGGAAGFVVKPFVPDVMLSAVAAALGESGR
jgi:two-component system, chemotaxis family, chemotaxis protein CheY